MRKLLIIMGLVFIQTNFLTAQTYLPLFKLDSTEWNINLVGVNGVFDSNEMLKYKVTQHNNDTLIYKEYSSQDWDSLFISVKHDNSNAWIYLENFNRQILVYDITLEMGDSFQLYTYNENALDSIYIYVDTTYILDNRKVIEFRDFGNFLFEQEFGSSWKFRFIEGVGPVNFFYYGFQSLNLLSYPYLIICKKDLSEINYETFWEQYNYQNCNIKTSIINIKTKKITTYPNPTNDYINFQNVNVKNVVIYDEFGKEKHINIQNNILNISDFSSGIYFLLIEDIQGEKYYSKILKNKQQ